MALQPENAWVASRAAALARRGGRTLWSRIDVGKGRAVVGAKRALYKAPDRPEQVTLAVGFQAWMQRERMVNHSGTLKTASFGVGWYVPAHDLRRTFATIADVVLDGNGRLIGLLLGHSQSAAQEGSALVNPVTGKYLVRNMQGERESSRQVAEAILQIAGMLPMDDELAAKFKKRGVDIEQITLLTVADV